VLGILVKKRFPLPLSDVTIMNRRIISIALVTCLSGVALIAFPFVDAAPPDSDGTHEHDEPRHKPLEKLSTVTGKVASWTTNREGVVDGFKVDAKTEVKFPPHQSEAILASVRVGGEVVVDGRRHETPKGDLHLHANRVSSGDTVIEIDRPEPKKHEGHPPHVQIVDEL